jgi:Fic-DOC domain mobile mystery protein B
MKVAFEDLLPGETPIDDVSGLLVQGIGTRRELSIAEAANIRKVLVKYFANRPTFETATFDYDWVLSLHREMYKDVWGWAGSPRRRDLNLGVPWAQIPERLYNLLEDLKCWKDSGVDLIEQATRLHHVAVQIHPFLNGNGRWGRMLTNIWLNLHGSPEVAWPEETIGDESMVRGEYIMALKAADDGDYEPLLEMHRRYLAREETA